MFCTFIFAVLVLKYCFPTADQLQRYWVVNKLPQLAKNEQ